jgi:hypothetical protein
MNRQKSIDVLGFDPWTQEYGAQPGLYKLTPLRAQYILDYHNEDNRARSKAQQANIGESIDTNGYQNDGDALRLNKEGNIPEYQHRLFELIKKDMTVYVPLVLGVEPESFTKTAGALPRGPWAEIYRIDKTAEKDEVTTLGKLIKRHYYKSGSGFVQEVGKKKELSLQNAAKLWPEWKTYVREGENLTKFFFDDKGKWSKERATFASWAALMARHGQGKYVTILLNMLKNETLGIESKALTKELIDLYENSETAYFSNTHRPVFMWYLLCVASDRIMRKSTGDIQLSLSIGECNHDNLKLKGTYRKFLIDVDGIY